MNARQFQDQPPRSDARAGAEGHRGPPSPSPETDPDFGLEKAPSSKGLLERLVYELTHRARQRESGASTVNDADCRSYLDQLLVAAYRMRDHEQSQALRIAELELERERLTREVEGLRKRVADREQTRKPARFPSFTRHPTRQEVTSGPARAADGGLKRPVAPAARRVLVARPAPAEPTVADPAGPPVKRADTAPLNRALKLNRRRKSRVWVMLPKVAAVVTALGAVVGAVGAGLDRDMVLHAGLAVALISGVLALAFTFPKLLANLVPALGGNLPTARKHANASHAGQG